MKTGKFIGWIFFASVAFSIVGAFFKIRHWEGADTILTVSMIATLAYIIAAIYEVQTSHRIDQREKTMWTIAFILLNGVAGLVYFLMGRKRVVAD
jgi:predicted transporter